MPCVAGYFVADHADPLTQKGQATATAAEVDVHGTWAASANHRAVLDVLPHRGHRQRRWNNHQPGLAFWNSCIRLTHMRLQLLLNM